MLAVMTVTVDYIFKMCC